MPITMGGATIDLNAATLLLVALLLLAVIAVISVVVWLKVNHIADRLEDLEVFFNVPRAGDDED